MLQTDRHTNRQESETDNNRSPSGAEGSSVVVVVVWYLWSVIVTLLTEREQNRNQATADITRPSPSNSTTDQSRVSLPTTSSLVIDTSNSFPCMQTPPDGAASSSGSATISTGTQTPSAESTSASSADDKSLPSIGECCDDVANKRRGKKRYAGLLFCGIAASYTRNTLDCDRSNYSSCIVFSHILAEFGPTRNSAIRSADPENPTVEPNMKWIGRLLAEIWPFEIFKIERLVVDRSSILLTLISYTPLDYIRNVACEE